MLGFETITMAPIDLELVETAMLIVAERDWLNAYHRSVRAALMPVLAGDESASAWLVSATRAI
jgi:Xaa-Pro aminopeptidase